MNKNTKLTKKVQDTVATIDGMTRAESIIWESHVASLKQIKESTEPLFLMTVGVAIECFLEEQYEARNIAFSLKQKILYQTKEAIETQVSLLMEEKEKNEN